MNYKKELAKLNVSEEDLRKNKRLGNVAQAIDDLLGAKAEMERRLKSGEGDADEINADIEEVKKDILELDETLTSQIPAWHKKKMDFVNKMQTAQAKSREASSNPAPQKSPEKKAAPAPKADEQPAAPVVAAQGGEVAPAKKSNSGAFIFFGVLALVVTVGAVNLLKNK